MSPRHGAGAVAGAEDDDETGVLITDGTIPAECFGRHCTECGEDIEVAPLSLPPEPGEFVAEWRHVARSPAGREAIPATVHCVTAWQDGRPVAFGGVAAPCWSPGCRSNAEHEAG